MTEPVTIRLGVNIDHVATLRQARRVAYPEPLAAALMSQAAGADGITMHLREDRRHIQDHDLFEVKEAIDIPLNLEMALTQEMVDIALKLQPKYCCIVPEKRTEVTTEGGLNVVGEFKQLQPGIQQLNDAGIEVSMFIDPDNSQIEASHKLGASIVELHTGCYANATSDIDQHIELEKLNLAAKQAHQLGLVVNAGHGLHYDNVTEICSLDHLNELNIGHSIIAYAVFVGLERAVQDMKSLLDVL